MHRRQDVPDTEADSDNHPDGEAVFLDKELKDGDSDPDSPDRKEHPGPDNGDFVPDNLVLGNGDSDPGSPGLKVRHLGLDTGDSVPDSRMQAYCPDTEVWFLEQVSRLPYLQYAVHWKAREPVGR